MEQLGFTLTDIYHLFLLMFRTGALVITVPVFGHVSIPHSLKILFIILISFLLLPSSFVADIEGPETMFHLVIVIFHELAVGFVMGFSVVLIFTAVQFAGHIVGLQMGLAVANIYDPMSSGQVSIIAQFYYMLSLLLFFLVNGHHMVIHALVRCFELVPVGGAVFNEGLQTYMIDLSYMMFVTGVKLVAPVIVTLYIINIVLGIVARTVPQMNVFIVGFPLSIGVGFAMIGVSFPFFYLLLTKVFRGIEHDFATVIRIFSGG